MTGQRFYSNRVVETHGERTAAHERLELLIGIWSVEKETTWPVLGQRSRRGGSVWLPARSGRQVWGGRFLTDTTSGEFGGQPYFGVGVLGFSVIDDRYEWNTVDGANAMMMTYRETPKPVRTRSSRCRVSSPMPVGCIPTS